MLRRIFYLASVCMTLLCTAVLWQWHRGYSVVDEIGRNSYSVTPTSARRTLLRIESQGGVLLINYSADVSPLTAGASAGTSWHWRTDLYLPIVHFYQLQRMPPPWVVVWQRGDWYWASMVRRSGPYSRRWTQARVPIWPIAAASAILPLGWIGSRCAASLRRRQRRRQVRCVTCGYSLTGNTSGACPECGSRTIST